MMPLLNSWSTYCYAVFCVLIPFLSHAQAEIPLGSWRVHISSRAIHTVSLGNNYVFGASENGIVVLDRVDNSLSTYSKINGLLGTGITSILYDNTTDQLVVAYKDGRIDLIQGSSISSIDPTRNSTITGSKRINHITIRDNLAYLAADYGIVIFDLRRGDVKETWRDIGVSGETVKVFQSTFNGDSIFLATDKGVLAGDLRQNLLDFNFWKHFNTGDFADSIHSIAAFNGTVFATVNKVGLYRYEAGQWTKENFFQNEPVLSLNASSENLLISAATTLWRLSTANTLTQIVSEKIEQPNMAIEEPTGQLWIADDRNGIVSNPSNSFINYLPNGPSSPRIHKLAYHNNAMYALGGGYSSAFSPLRIPGNVDQFNQGVWSTQHSALYDLTDIEFDNTNRTFLASFGYGVEERDDQSSLQIFDETNSPLVNTNPPLRFVSITDMQTTDDGLWIANYGVPQSLHFLSKDYSWSSYAFNPAASQYPMALMVDHYNNVWLILNPDQGGGVVVFNTEKNSTSYLSNIDGAGGLPSKSVRSVALDRDGVVWLGTDEGVCYFVDPTAVFSPGVNSIRPIFENRFLLRDDKVTAIAVDGGNRKWMGTERGVWLFSPSGEELIYNFTIDNSPLLSNVILDIEINHHTGEVFFATDQGLVSFRADATESDFQFQTIKIFPNPVTPEFNGTVGITGLATDAIVKITDISGKLIWETRANGGTASWNVRDYTGKRASTGIYLVFSASADGIENEVGKIAVVE